MRSIVNLIKKKGRNQFILNFVLLILLCLAGFYIFTVDRIYTDAFKGKCEVHSLDDLEYCYENNYYVRIYLDEVYSTNYGYYVNNTLKAYYVDIDVEGYSLITLVERDIAKELFSDNNSITYIDGVITYLDEYKDHNGVIDGIKKDYLENFGEEYTMEDIDSLILPIQVNSYQNPKSTFIFILMLLVIGLIVVIPFMIKGLLKMLKPDNYKGFSKIENKDKLEEEYENNVIVEKSNICLLPNYIIRKNAFNIKVKEKKDLIWVYKKIYKQNGITVNKCYILNFKDGDNFDISLKDENILNEFSQNILIGYTNQNRKEYRKIVNETKREK